MFISIVLYNVYIIILFSQSIRLSGSMLTYYPIAEWQLITVIRFLLSDVLPSMGVCVCEPVYAGINF